MRDLRFQRGRRPRNPQVHLMPRKRLHLHLERHRRRRHHLHLERRPDRLVAAAVGFVASAVLAVVLRGEVQARGVDVGFEGNFGVLVRIVRTWGQYDQEWNPKNGQESKMHRFGADFSEIVARNNRSISSYV